MDEFGSTVALLAPAGGGDAGVGGSMGIAPISATAYNPMAAMNHMRFECGVDLKAALKTSRRQLLKGLWAAPDSPEWNRFRRRRSAGRTTSARADRQGSKSLIAQRHHGIDPGSPPRRNISRHQRYQPQHHRHTGEDKRIRRPYSIQHVSHQPR